MDGFLMCLVSISGSKRSSVIGEMIPLSAFPPHLFWPYPYSGVDPHLAFLLPANQD